MRLNPLTFYYHNTVTRKPTYFTDLFDIQHEGRKYCDYDFRILFAPVCNSCGKSTILILSNLPSPFSQESTEPTYCTVNAIHHKLVRPHFDIYFLLVISTDEYSFLSQYIICSSINSINFEGILVRVYTHSVGTLYNINAFLIILIVRSHTYGTLPESLYVKNC